MDLKISRRHVKEGRPNHPCECPTALALKTAGVKHFHVGSNEIRFYDHEPDSGRCTNWMACPVISRVTMPKRLVKAISQFDNNKKFETGVYRIPGLKKPKKGGHR